MFTIEMIDISYFIALKQLEAKWVNAFWLRKKTVLFANGGKMLPFH